MTRKILSILGLALLLIGLYSCSSHPEKALLGRYFNSLSMNDLQTLSTMAVDPINIEFDSWEITNVSEEVVIPAALADLNQTEKDLQKKVQDSVGITLDSRGDLDDAIFERDNARTGAARRAAQAKIEETQTKYDEQYAAHQQLQKDFNIAKEEAAKEEAITSFSLGDEYPNVKEFTGEVFYKEVDVRVIGSEGTSDYKIFLRRYILKDEAANIHHRGRWIIVRFQKS